METLTSRKSGEFDDKGEFCQVNPKLDYPSPMRPQLARRKVVDVAC